MLIYFEHIKGIGPVPNVYAAECFPLSHREIGTAFAIFVNNLLSTIFSLTYPSILASFTPTGGEFSQPPFLLPTDRLRTAFGFFAGLNMLALLIVFLFLPETK